MLTLRDLCYTESVCGELQQNEPVFQKRLPPARVQPVGV